jgi:hypothetical protein
LEYGNNLIQNLVNELKPLSQNFTIISLITS